MAPAAGRIRNRPGILTSLCVACPGPLRWEAALAEANRFGGHWPTVRQHWPRLFGESARGGDGCDGSELEGPVGRGLTGSSQVSTLEQSPESRRYGSEPGESSRGVRAG